MQIRALAILCLALLMGGVSVFLVNDYLKKEVGERRSAMEVPMTHVVVTTKNLEFGNVIVADTLKLLLVPEDMAPADSFKTIDEVVGTGKPAIALGDIKANEVLLPHKLSPHGARGGMPAKIPEDMRALTIAVNEVRGVAGFVLPGDFVDILHTTNVGRKDEIEVTRVLMQNAQVLGIDQISAEDKSEPVVVNAVTLLVSQRDGQRLTLAQRLGELNLLLRNEFDGSLLQENVIAYSDLLTVDPNKKAKVRIRSRRATPSSIEVIRGLNIEKEKVKEGEPIAIDNRSKGLKTVSINQ